MPQLAVVIGRFQPAHKHHVQTLLKAASAYDAGLILLGSSYRARDWKNPFRWEERSGLIDAACDDLGVGPLFFTKKGIKDYPYNDNRWVLQIQKTVEEHLQSAEDPEVWEVVLVGANKDASTYYLELFPQWSHHFLEPTGSVSATTVRRAVYEDDWETVAKLTTPNVCTWLKNWAATAEGCRIREEYEAAQRGRLVLAYESADGSLTKAAFPPLFHTVDVVLLHKGHVLLIERRSHPGKGLWALPGGFLNAGEWPREGAIRELREETRIHFFLRGNRKRLEISPDWFNDSHQFANPGRSLRGRTITNAYQCVIPDRYEVEVQASDDAARARWFPLYDVLHTMDYELFEDHQAIVAHFALGNN
ncbi:MAG: NUDIX domain-containing protein [Myxococcota bacterium]